MSFCVSRKHTNVYTFYLFNLKMRYVNTTTAATIKTDEATTITISTVGSISSSVAAGSGGTGSKNIEHKTVMHFSTKALVLVPP